MIMPMRLDGLLFLLVTLATLALGAAGLLIQALVVLLVRYARQEASARAPWWRDLGRGVLGPLACLAFAGLTLLVDVTWIDGGHVTFEETLDDFALLVPVAAITVWIATHVVFSRATRGRVPPVSG